MPPRKYRRNSNKQNRNSPQNFFIGILLFIVIAESFWLARIYLKKTDGDRSLRREISIPLQSIKKEKQSPGRIAIIIDDSGYSANDCDHLKSISLPLTVSILPDLNYSRATAECAQGKQKEVMLHLPLEPHVNKEKYPEDYIIKTNMSAARVVKKFEHALQSVPYVTGINNHMGSKATEDTRLMSILFAQLNKNDLFFVDSRVTHRSVCRALARNKNLPFAQRDVFLDNENERAYIEKQFSKLSQTARKKGYAVGIGHARSLTWQIIKEQSEKLSREGFEFVTMKTLMESF